MPLYEFVCKSCDHQFEELVLGSAKPACPHCQGQKLEKLLSVFAVSGPSEEPFAAAGPCGSCGDPRGPGACSME